MPLSARLLATVVPLALTATAAHADVVISSAATQNMTCSAGVCAPTAPDAVLNASDLEALLASGNVEVTTTGTGVQAINLQIDSPLSWSSAYTLAVDAYETIMVTNPVVISGSGGLSITTADGGSGGYFWVRGGYVQFANLSSALTINGSTFTLVGDIETLAHDVSEEPSGHYALANTYDASKDGVFPYSPVGPLGGTFEGLGNTILNLTIDLHGRNEFETYNASLFSTSGGTIENLNLSKVNINSKNNRLGTDGSLVGENTGTLFNDQSSGTVTMGVSGCCESPIAGGLVGTNFGTITYASSSVRVRGPNVGGLVGENLGVISMSSASGNVTCSNFGSGGGLVSANFGTTGPNGSTISESYATGAVSGECDVAGGLAAFNEGFSEQTSLIVNSYAIGKVIGSTVGGFVGFNNGSNGPGVIESSYSTGAVSGAEYYTGGFAGENTSTFSDAYWDTTTSKTDQGVGSGSETGLTGLKSSQFRSALPSGFDPSIWAETKGVNNGFPYLIANPPPK